MATLYGLTYADVERFMGRSFSSGGRPSSSEVTTLLSEVANEANSRLAGLGFDVAAVAASETAAAWASRTVLMTVARDILDMQFDDRAYDHGERLARRVRDRWQAIEKSPGMLDSVYSASSDAGSIQAHDPIEYAIDSDVTFAADDEQSAF